MANHNYGDNDSRTLIVVAQAATQFVRSTAVGEVGTIRATGYPGTQE